MPWTFSHPAAVLPLRRLCPRYLSFPALLVGSTMPDFGYYIPGSAFSTHAHSFLGLVQTCMPQGLMVLWVLYVMRKPLCYLLPQPHRVALTPLFAAPVVWNVSLLVKVMLSLVVGAATHLIWDAFTHQRDLVGLHMDLLQAPVFAIGATVVPVYYVLQWASTLLGAACLTVAYLRWLRLTRAPALSRVNARADRWRYRLLKSIALMALIFAVPLAVGISARYTGAFAMAVLLRYIAVFGAMAFALLISASAVYCYAQRES